jgi:hypothetical protein
METLLHGELISASITFKSDEEYGNHVVAVEAIEPGTVIMRARGFAETVRPDRSCSTALLIYKGRM